MKAFHDFDISNGISFGTEKALTSVSPLENASFSVGLKSRLKGLRRFIWGSGIAFGWGSAIDYDSKARKGMEFEFSLSILKIEVDFMQFSLGAAV